VNSCIFNFDNIYNLTILPYIRYFFASTFFVLGLVAAMNYIVDPANIYHQNITPASYADALVSSRYGLYDKEGTVDERLLAKALALKLSDVDCIVVGSSRVMQISSKRELKTLPDLCDSILNLGVSSGVIEDHITMTYFAINKKQNDLPNKIILGVDPWIFAFGKEQLWTVYRDDFFIAKQEIFGTHNGDSTNQEKFGVDEVNKKKLENLINLEYTIRSLQKISMDYRTGKPAIIAAPKINYAIGGAFPIRLGDNSHIHSAKFISNSIGAPIPLGGVTYNTEGALNQLNAIRAYRDLILWIKGKGVEPILLMTPYHENVLKKPDSPNAIALKNTEPIVLSMAKELDVKVVGSYDPKIFGCSNREFYDFLHPTAECLQKLRAR
jgi:hypothetical protein